MYFDCSCGELDNPFFKDDNCIQLSIVVPRRSLDLGVVVSIERDIDRPPLIISMNSCGNSSGAGAVVATDKSVWPWLCAEHFQGSEESVLCCSLGV